MSTSDGYNHPLSQKKMASSA